MVKLKFRDLVVLSPGQYVAFAENDDEPQVYGRLFHIENLEPERGADAAVRLWCGALTHLSLNGECEKWCGGDPDNEPMVVDVYGFNNEPDYACWSLTDLEIERLRIRSLFRETDERLGINHGVLGS